MKAFIYVHIFDGIRKCDVRLETYQYCFNFVFPCIIVKVKWNTNLMQHCAGFISAESLYMFRAQAPIIRSI